VDLGYVFERAWFTYFLLLSWAGHATNSRGMKGDRLAAFCTCLRKISACGIDLGIQVSYANALWSEARGSVQLIGFRYAGVVKQRQALDKRRECDEEERSGKRIRILCIS
jgi:hypothetical protein